MKCCEQCRELFDRPMDFCPSCGTKLTIPYKTDAWLKNFLEIDDIMLARFKEIREQAMEEIKKLNKKNKKIKALGVSGSSRDEFGMAGEKSNSETLLESGMEELKELGAETEIIKLRQYNIKPCQACYSTTNAQCHFYCSCYPKGTPAGDDMSNILYDKILSADIIIFATPVNDMKVSSYLSLFIDRCISLDGSLYPADPKAAKNKELNKKHTKFITIMADQKIAGSGYIRRFAGKVAGIIVTGHEEGAVMVISSLFVSLNHFGMVFPPYSAMYAMASVAEPTFADKKIVTDNIYIEEAKGLVRNTWSMATQLKKNNKQDWHYDHSLN